MSLNKVMLIGNVGKDPDIRYTESGLCTATFSLATSSPGYTLPNGTNVPERTEWHQILLWRKLAEIAEKYVRKGDKLYIEGEIRYRSYTDSRGKNQTITEVWGSRMEILSPRPQTEKTGLKPQSPTPKEDCPF